MSAVTVKVALIYVLGFGSCFSTAGAQSLLSPILDDLEVTLYSDLQLRELNDRTPFNKGNTVFDLSKSTQFANLNAYYKLNNLVADINVVEYGSGFELQNPEIQMRQLYKYFLIDYKFNIGFGKKMFYWGSGYFRNPAAFVNFKRDPTNPADRLKEYTGKPFIHIGYFFPESNIDLVYIPEITLNLKQFEYTATELVFRYYRFFKDLDLSLLLKYNNKKHNAAGGSMAYTLQDDLVLHFEGALQHGYKKQIHHSIVSGESDTVYQSYPYDRVQSEHLIPKLLAGFNFTTQSGFNIIGEYYYNGLGLSYSDWNDLLTHLEYLNSSKSDRFGKGAVTNNIKWSALSLNDRKHYLLLRFQRSFSAIDANLVTLSNIVDASTFLRLQAGTKIVGPLRGEVQIERFAGAPKTDFGSIFYKWNAHLTLTFKL
ncbi:hypothetical protein [Fodinibius halophilus]|uniref:Capsule assembly Wzi family protein n=1 Tax=Fodinibius halophilus TaxID=1736908 RepID=A0A6M1T9H0_9BACT|nr:hypothetical protein [Fodinibius halophilus]NGP86992.1 hypothetical protein [Fodinibius halophilus]